MNLSSKISLFNNQNDYLLEKYNKDLPINSIVQLIKLKLENGNNAIHEIQLLEDLNFQNDKISYIEKLKILSNKNFIGLKRLNNDTFVFSATLHTILF